MTGLTAAVLPAALSPVAPQVECVPNFAEGRDRAVVHAVLSAMQLPGVLLLDYAIDPERNRTVVTLAGTPDAVSEAVIRATGVAVERIDLTRQVGAHPRIGAMDVLPFVPIAGLGLMPCVKLARDAAIALWERYSVPSYLYEAAASRPDRVLLEDVRRGQFEGLRDAVHRDASRRPDVGGPGLHPSAGATAIGARRLLIEYSVKLATDDIGVARAIARAVRAESSGLTGVRALALLVEGRAQVAFGIADFRQTGLGAVHSAVVQAAHKQKVRLLAGALVGLLPEAAYEAGSDWAGELSGFNAEDRILERRLANPLAWPAAL